MGDDIDYDHDAVADHLREVMEWPQYYVVGEDVDDFVPAYYLIEGPNGPVSYMNPNSGPFPTTMYDFAMEAQSESFHQCEREDTPWEDYDAPSEPRDETPE